jgi:ankyrin repeat protein
MVKLLLDAGANPLLPDDDGCTALLWAAYGGHQDCVELLMDSGADATQADCLGVVPLFSAVMFKNVECAKLLLPSSDLGHFSMRGQSVLHAAAGTGSDACVKLLLKQPSLDVNVRTKPGFKPDGSPIPSYGETPLMFTCQKDFFEITKALLKSGASRLARDESHKTPLHHAATFGSLSCVVLLVGRPGKIKMTPEEVDVRDIRGLTPLHCAAGKGHEKVCAALIEAGASLFALDNFGRAPFVLAALEHPTKASLLTLLTGAGPEHPPGTICDRCGKTAQQAGVGALRECGNCFMARYCCEACAAAAWREHKMACRAHVAAREVASRPNIVS